MPNSVLLFVSLLQECLTYEAKTARITTTALCVRAMPATRSPSCVQPCIDVRAVMQIPLLRCHLVPCCNAASALPCETGRNAPSPPAPWARQAHVSVPNSLRILSGFVHDGHHRIWCW
jgi:hypothetical protein